MKKKFSLLLALILLLTAVIPAAAQSSVGTKAPGAWTSSINIQNVDTAAADVTLNFYNEAGALVLSDTTSISGANAIGAGKNRTIVVSNLKLGAGQYSVVVESSKKLEVVANATSTGPVTAGAYQGIKTEQTAAILYFPGLYKDYYNFNSEFVLQNTDATKDANVTIEFYLQSSGAKIAGATKTGQIIPKNSSRVFSLANLGGLPTGKTGLVSAKVISTGGQKLAGVANIWTPYKYGEFGDYNGYLAGATTIYAPALYKNYYGFVSSLTVMNLGKTTTNVEVTYSNGKKEAPVTLKPFQAKEFYQPANANLPSGNTAVFSARIVSKPAAAGAAAQPIVALVNVEDKVKGLFGSYNAPASTAAATKMACPTVTKEYFGWFSAETVQNVGTSPTNIKVTYSDGKTVTFTNIAAMGTKNVVENTSAKSVLSSGSSVAAVIESVGLNGKPAQPLVVIVQGNNTNYNTKPGDYLLAYTCTAKQ